jgi:hypothetical protein
MYFYPIPQKHPPEYISGRALGGVPKSTHRNHICGGALGGGGFLFANCCIPFLYGNYLRLQQTRKPFNAPKAGQTLGRFCHRPPTISVRWGVSVTVLPRLLYFKLLLGRLTRRNYTATFCGC